MTPPRLSLAAALLGACAVVSVAAGADAGGAKLATVRVVDSALVFEPLVAFDRAIVDLRGQRGTGVQEEFPAETTISVPLVDASGEPLADGTYGYQIRVEPPLAEGPSFQRGMFEWRDGAADFKPVPSMARPGVGGPRPRASPDVQGRAARHQQQAQTREQQLAARERQMAMHQQQVMAPPQAMMGARGAARELRLRGAGAESPTWVLSNDHDDAAFVIRDNDTGVTPFRVRAGAPEGAVTLGADGSLAIRRESADHPVHVGTDSGSGNGAHLTAGGVWTDASSRSLKEEIEPLSDEEAQAALRALAPVKFRFKGLEERHVGFIAEDAPSLIATADRRGLSPMDVAAVLARVTQSQAADLARQDRTIVALREESRRLSDSVAALERRLVGLQAGLAGRD